jgi:tight adherence protein C
MDFLFLSFVSSAFVAVAAIVFGVGEYVLNRNQLQRRLAVEPTAAETLKIRSNGTFDRFVKGTFTEERFGVDGKLRRKLRRDLLRAGFFKSGAIRYYVFARILTVFVLPCVTFICAEIFLPTFPFGSLTFLVAIAAGVGVLGPDAYLSRRQTALMNEYRVIFPDLLDLLTVCVTAGLSVEASFDRIRDQLGKRSVALGQNIDLMGAEMRAGRSSIEALNSLADRLGLDEAASFVAVLRHSLELGGDVATSLRVFSDEMRSKRMLVAEAKANELPVKMVIPMALGIFPVILAIIMMPIILKLMKVMHS